MAVEIPSIEPTEIFAGDTVSWTKDISDYPATSWTLTYYLRGPANIDIVASASGREFLVSKTAAVTAAWASGLYHWKAFVSDADERYLVGEGEITISANPSGVMTFETRSKAKVILDAIDATILRAAGRLESSYSIEAAGRSFTFKSMADLIVARDKFAAIVQAEEDAKKIERGENTGRNILIRFN